MSKTLNWSKHSREVFQAYDRQQRCRGAYATLPPLLKHLAKLRLKYFYIEVLQEFTCVPQFWIVKREFVRWITQDELAAVRTDN